jgi:hypothetical protein
MFLLTSKNPQKRIVYSSVFRDDHIDMVCLKKNTIKENDGGDEFKGDTL